MTSEKLSQPRLAQLGAYPFERLKKLFKGSALNPELAHIDAGAGEPRLPLPAFVSDIVNRNLDGFSKYPSTCGGDVLRKAIAGWLMRRFNLSHVDASTQVLAANGTREALFTVAHALVNPELKNGEKPYVLMPNPMYQIYLGAAFTAGARPYLMACTEESGFAPELASVPENVWKNTAVVYVCSPSNPTGWIADAEYYRELLMLADRHDFYVLADECYSEIYWEKPPVGLLEVAGSLGRKNFERCLVFNSLSKRSALPGLRSGLIAGDATLIERFTKLRSYTGPATPLPLQMVAAAAWSDETHVERHLAIYQQSLRSFFDALGDEAFGEMTPPAGSFFVWLPVNQSLLDNDEAFAVAAYEQQSITLLPGSYLGTDDHRGHNSGAGYIRAALVDGPEKAAELAERLKAVRV